MDNQINRKIEKSSDLSVFYHEGAYGLIKDHAKPNAILINDATLWTCGPKGTLAEWDILFVDGKIEQVGQRQRSETQYREAMDLLWSLSYKQLTLPTK